MGLKAFKIKGFTLIELMLVVAIIGLLAAIAIPKFGDLVIKAKEAAVKGKLGALRSAVSIYYSDNEGLFPSAASPAVSLTTGSKYLDAIPEISIPTVPAHTNNNGMLAVLLDWADPVGGPVAWRYSFPSGTVVVNCTHTDSKGTTWSLW